MISSLDYEDYRLFLKDVLAEKSQKNAAFSLRSFSKSLGISPSHLSRVFSRQKKLSPTMAQKISYFLKLSKVETAHFNLIVQLDAESDPQMRAEIYKQISRQSNRTRRSVSLERFKVIADWQHFAILALTKMKRFQSDPGWIAKKLGIKKSEADAAIDRLILADLLEKDSSGKLCALEGADISTSDDISSAAIKENHRQQMIRAEVALTNQPIECREFNNLAVMIKPKDVVMAKKKIRDFIESFNQEMDSSSGTELYQLNVQFFQSSVSESESL